MYVHASSPIQSNNKINPTHTVSFTLPHSAMASLRNQLHFVLFPLMAQGHLIPMVDIARLLAQHGMIVTIVTTRRNASRFAAVSARAMESNLKIQVRELQFPSEKADLPEGCENIDMLPSLGLAGNLFTGTSLLQQPAEDLFRELTPKPGCIISDMTLPWTSSIAIKYHVPRICFTGFCCFCMLCAHNIYSSKVLENIDSDTENFVVPGLPDHVELSKGQLPGSFLPNMDEFNNQIMIAENDTYGIIMNSFEELEPAYAIELKKAKGNKVWCVGPVSLCNKDNLDKVQRGNKAVIDEHECFKWLDSWEMGSVLYVSFGSLCNLILQQLVELGMALEALNRPFIWVIRVADKSQKLEKWIAESGFQERIRGRGLIIWGWAPQVLILSHPAIGGFLTHCGWNSTLEAICAGVPMVTWPLFADQFCNEKLVVQVLKIGVSVGVAVPLNWGQEEKIGLLVRKEDIVIAVDRLMKECEEKEKRRERAKEFAKMAMQAVEEGGSSHLNMEMLIQDIGEQVEGQKLN